MNDIIFLSVIQKYIDTVTFSVLDYIMYGSFVVACILLIFLIGYVFGSGHTVIRTDGDIYDTILKKNQDT